MKYVPGFVPEDYEGFRQFIDEELNRIANSVNKHPYAFTPPASINKVAGGTPVGDVTDIQTMLDGNVYNLPEVAAAPGFDLEVDFSSIDRIDGIVLRAYYGPKTSTHYSELRIHNYQTTNDDTIINFQPADDYNVRTILIPDGEDYLDGSGNAQLTFYHPPSGNLAHDLFIDYVALLSINE